MLSQAQLFVGIDWAAESHAVCVLDGRGRVAGAFTIAHTVDGFADLARRLGRLTGDPEQVPVAIERPDGRLVDALLEAGHPVVPVKPNAIKAWRDAEVLSGAKSDEADAEVIAEYLRLRAHKLRPTIPSSETKALRTVAASSDANTGFSSSCCRLHHSSAGHARPWVMISLVARTASGRWRRCERRGVEPPRARHRVRSGG